MHSFTELVYRSARFTLNGLRVIQDRVVEELQTSAATHLVKTLQMIQLQKAIMAVGMFSIFGSIVQDRLNCDDGFAVVRKHLEREGMDDLVKRFSQFFCAINVLKHGRGRSYDALLAQRDELPFRMKGPDEKFFFEGDVSEISTLIEVDDRFVLRCAEVIREVSDALSKTLGRAM